MLGFASWLAEYHPLAEMTISWSFLMEARPWEHSYSLPDKFSLEYSEDPVDAPSLVVQLAHSVLRRLQEEGSRVSSDEPSVSETELTDLVAAAGGKPLPIATSESPSPSPTPSPRRPRRTSSSNESGPARAPNGRFSAEQE